MNSNEIAGYNAYIDARMDGFMGHPPKSDSAEYMSAYNEGENQWTDEVRMAAEAANAYDLSPRY